jgi:NADH dehydrogenase (ubiquinone) 1 alpha subcomplex subunit 5
MHSMSFIRSILYTKAKTNCIHLKRLFSSSSATKTSTGLTGLIADANSRQNLISLYSELKSKISILPEDLVYRNGMLAILKSRRELLTNEAYSDLDVETKIGEGQLEELVDQAHDEIKLVDKLSNEWKPWETSQ